MPVKAKILPLCLMALLVYSSSVAQERDTVNVGEVSGIVKDSLHNYILQLATLAVYTAKDSGLVNYQLSDNFGRFHFKSLPIGESLMIVASYTGYKTTTRHFFITSDKKSIELGNLNLEKGITPLNTVTITSVPPVRMNGDTLEFNADAFQTVPNAVAEDLLRKLPGVVIWGDGLITVNGRKVKTILVDGKPFFGNDPTIATRNIPKNAIDKVQIYQKNKNRDDPLDSVTAMNIKLKAGKHFGHFGKLSAGYGTNKRYDITGGINFFSPQTKLGIIGAANNTNKVAHNVSQLMHNNTFKEGGAIIDYQPDFLMQGINNNYTGGLTFRHDFPNRANAFKAHYLSGNYFYSNNEDQITNDQETIISTGGDSTITQKLKTNNHSTSINQKLDAVYTNDARNHSLRIKVNGISNNANNTNNSYQNSQSNTLGPQSENNSQTNSHSTDKTFTLSSHFSTRKSKGTNTNAPGNWQIDYKLTVESNKDKKRLKSSFISLINPDINRNFDRKYYNKSDNIGHHLSVQLGNFSYWIFGVGHFMSTIAISLQNEIDLHKQDQHNTIMDLDPVQNKYIDNPYLTNKSHSTNFSDFPAVNFSKTFINSLADRFQKSFTITTQIRAQLYHQKNTSTHSFQNYTRNYTAFVPNLSLSYKNKVYGVFDDSYFLKYNIARDYAGTHLLYPLIDSSNIYSIQAGNPNLRPSTQHNISFNFSHSNLKAGSNFDYTIFLEIGWRDQFFADSAIVDESGIYRHYTVNLNGNKFFRASLDLNKAIKVYKNHFLQFKLTDEVALARLPGYMLNQAIGKSIYNISYTTNNRSKLSITYNYEDLLTLNLMEEWSLYHSTQKGITNRKYNINDWKSKFSLSVNGSRRLRLNTNIANNHYQTTASEATNFIIWNANISYRLLHDDNLELKFSALDILHQNKGFISTGNLYSITHATVNVLQQYFLFSISYFPRKFGKREVKGKK